MPRECQDAFGKREVVPTLRTTSKREADELALDVVKELDRAVRLAQQTTRTADCTNYFEPTDEQLEAAVRQVYVWEVDSDWEERNYTEHMELMGLGGEESAETYLKEAKRLKRAASGGDYSAANDDYWAEVFKFCFPDNNVKKNRFRKLLAYAYGEAIARCAEHDLGDRSGKPNMRELQQAESVLPADYQRAETAVENCTTHTHSGAKSRSFGELWPSHVRQRGQKVKSATLTDRFVSVKLFANYVGDQKSVSQITKVDARSWRELLYEFPTHATQRKELKGFNFQSIVSEGKKLRLPPISERTVAKHLSGLFAFYQWLVDEGLATENVFSGLAPTFVSGQKRAGEFSDEQLIRLFGSPLFIGCAGTRNIVEYSTSGATRVRDWRYWLPLLAAFSGARLGELAQLHVDDIRSSDGIHFLDINDDGGGDKTVKSGWSSRIVPLHSELLNLGFLEFVGAQRDEKQTRLFPELERTERGYFDKASKWFGRYFGRLEFETDARGHKPTFHSFRHSAIERMSKELTDNEIGPLVGHEEATTTKGYRNSPTYSIRKRKEQIEHIMFRGLDLTHLNKFQPN